LCVHPLLTLFQYTAPTEIYTLSLHDALPISTLHAIMPFSVPNATIEAKETLHHALFGKKYAIQTASDASNKPGVCNGTLVGGNLDRKSTRLNSSHVKISYAVFCLKKKKINQL